VATMDRYSTLAEERETLCCFLVFQEMGKLPRSTNQLISECLDKGQLVQPESHKA